MAKTYSQLTRQIQALTAQAEKAKRKEAAGVIERIKAAIESYGLTAADLGLDGSKARSTTRKASAAPVGKRAKEVGKKAARPVKFRNADGQVWSGRGPRPHWLRDALKAGKDLQDFAV